MTPTKLFALASILLGIAAILLPWFFGTLAVMVLGFIMLASGVVSLLYVLQARKYGIVLSVFGPWAQIIAGAVILIWPQLTLWLLAVLLGGGLILTGVTGLSTLRNSAVINPPGWQQAGLWISIAIGALLILLGSFGSALLLSIVLGVALISNGLQQWHAAR